MKIIKYKVTILGCGSSSGVPSIESGFGICTPDNSKNYRTRTSAFLEIFYEDSSSIKILIDCSPDFRYQCLKSNITHIDTILFTHKHADHIYGIHEIRSVNRLMKKHIDAYLNQDTLEGIKDAFAYIFRRPIDIETLNSTNKNHDIFYKPVIAFNIIDYYQNIKLNDNLDIYTTKQVHGTINTVGYVFNKKIAYATDFSHLNETTLESYHNLDLLIVSAATDSYHVSHMKLDDVIKMIEKLAPKHAVLTHMSGKLDYDTLKNTLPAYIEPAYDGMEIIIK